MSVESLQRDGRKARGDCASRGLEVRGVLGERGGRVLFREVGFDVRPGEVLAIRGPNGSGKTTLLEVLALVRSVGAGLLRLDGQPASRGDLVMRRRITLVSRPALLFRGTVIRNVAYGLRVRGVARREARDRAREALGRVGAEGLADRRSRELSAGERQRVALARGLAIAPRVLLLDEPTAHLDADGVDRVAGALASLQREGRTVIIVATPGDCPVAAGADRSFDLGGDERTVAGG